MSESTRRLAVRGFAMQVEALARSSTAADEADKIVRNLWSNLLTMLKSADSPAKASRLYDSIKRLLSPLSVDLITIIGRTAEEAGMKAHAAQAAALADNIPPEVMRSYWRPGISGIGPRGPVDMTIPFRMLPRDEQKAAFQSLILPGPTKKQVQDVVYQSGWAQRLSTQTSLADPHRIAVTVANNLSRGQSIRDLASDLLPIFDGIKSSARRVARDESMHAAHHFQQQAWNQVDDLIIGYQVNAVLDDRTRPAHRVRNGQKYYKHPKAGQMGMDECPHPPRESVKDGSAWAYNCRCFLTPIMVIDAHTDNPLTLPVAPLDRTYTANWFDAQNATIKRTAAGSTRYQLAKERLGREPTWFDLTNAAGDLLPI